MILNDTQKIEYHFFDTQFLNNVKIKYVINNKYV